MFELRAYLTYVWVDPTMEKRNEPDKAVKTVKINLKKKHSEKKNSLYLAKKCKTISVSSYGLSIPSCMRF